MRPKSLCLFEFIDKFHICFDITVTNVESGHGHAGVKESDDVLDLGGSRSTQQTRIKMNRIYTYPMVAVILVFLFE